MRQTRICTAAIAPDHLGRVLMLRRIVEPWAGFWCWPGGKLDEGESLEACVARELWEETGLRADSFAFEGLTETWSPATHMIGLVYRAVGLSGTVTNAEPGKHDRCEYRPWHDLPRPLMPGVAQWLASRLPGANYH